MGGAGHPPTEYPATVMRSPVVPDFHRDSRGRADLTVVGFVNGYRWSASKLSMELVPRADEIGWHWLPQWSVSAVIGHVGIGRWSSECARGSRPAENLCHSQLLTRYVGRER
jgi:hypothetical protein